MMKRAIGILMVVGLAFASHADIILNAETVGSGTYFEVNPASDIRVNNDLIRVGRNNGDTFNFTGLLAFDVSGYTAELNAAPSIILGFDLGAQDNSPPLDEIAIDYIGTFADNNLGVNGVNGASANATTIANSPSINSIFSGAETAGTGKSYDATAIGSDSFDEQYAFFLVTDPNGGTHQWDIPKASVTLTIIPEPNTLVLVLAAGSVLLAFRRRNAL